MPTNAERAALLTGREVRRGTLPIQKVEVREADDTLSFSGLASSTSVRVGTIGEETSSLARDNGYDMGWYTERIMAGAFTTTLSRNPDVQLLVNHEGLPLARTTNGTLTLREDAERGLVFDATADSSDPDAQRVAGKIRSGLMDQCSFAFRVVRQSWSEDHDIREISEVDLSRGDVSVVNYGANPATSVQVRALFADLDLSDADVLELRNDPQIMAVVRSLFIPEAPAEEIEEAAEYRGLSLDLARARQFALSTTPRRSA